MNKASEERVNKSRGDRVLRRLDQLFKETRLYAKQGQQLFEIKLLRPAGVSWDQIFNFDNKEVHAATAWVALRLDSSKKKDSMILKAFEAAGLDARNPYDWKELVYAFSDTHFGDPGPGRKTSWDDFEYLKLLCNFYALKSRFPDLKAMDIRKHLRKQDQYKDLSDATLRRRIAHAGDPQKNRYLTYLKEETAAGPLEAVVRDELLRQGNSKSSNLDDWVKVTAAALLEVLCGPDKNQVRDEETIGPSRGE